MAFVLDVLQLLQAAENDLTGRTAGLRRAVEFDRSSARCILATPGISLDSVVLGRDFLPNGVGLFE